MHWYAVSTKPRQESQAQMNLGWQGIETFLPFLRKTKFIRRRRQAVVLPLFPGYLFARFNIEDHYRSVTYARGVRKIVEFGSTPAKVDEDLIDAIKSSLYDGCVILHPPVFIPGQVVRIQEGPLCGLEAIFQRKMDDHDRAVLLLRTLAYQARVVMPLKDVVNR